MDLSYLIMVLIGTVGVSRIKTESLPIKVAKVKGSSEARKVRLRLIAISLPGRFQESIIVFGWGWNLRDGTHYQLGSHWWLAPRAPSKPQRRQVIVV